MLLHHPTRRARPCTSMHADVWPLICTPCSPLVRSRSRLRLQHHPSRHVHAHGSCALTLAPLYVCTAHGHARAGRADSVPGRAHADHRAAEDVLLLRAETEVAGYTVLYWGNSARVLQVAVCWRHPRNVWVLEPLRVRFVSTSLSFAPFRLLSRVRSACLHSGLFALCHVSFTSVICLFSYTARD